VSNRLGKAIDESTDGSNAENAENLRSIQRLIEAIGRGDLETAIANAHPDVRFEIYAPPEFLWIRQATGIEGLRHAVRHNFDSVEDQHPEITSLTTQGDTIVGSQNLGTLS
jgi:ketosteroid isomerase-like protein